MQFQDILPVINSSVIALGGITVVVIYIFGSRSNVSKTVIDNYKTLDDQQKEKIAEQELAILKYQEDITEIRTTMSRMKEDFAKEIGKLQGELKSKDKQIADLQATVLNRNPKLEALLERIDVKMDVQTGMLKDREVIDEKVAKDLLKHNDKTDERNQAIDEATENQTGNVLRKE